jgi:DNA processing protein
MSDDARIDALRLALVSGVGPRAWQQLIAAFGSPTRVLEAMPSELEAVDGIGPKLSQAIARARHEIDADDVFATCEREAIDVLLAGASGYPASLREIPDPPGVLYCRGAIEPRDALAVAIVGSRHASLYGTSQAERLSGSLARAGFTIISGLARGIDAAAHRAALQAGGRTIAVLGSGLLNIYPPEHAELAKDITASGAVLSEAPLRMGPHRTLFPQRNRLISGLARGVIVIEASLKSGALITARHAMEQNRDVFAVPGRVDNHLSQGCHRLIRDGAKLIESADDVLEELGPLTRPVPLSEGETIHQPVEVTLNDLERQVLQTIDTSPTLVDQIITKSELPATQVLSTLTILEMRKLIRRTSGLHYARL